MKTVTFFVGRFLFKIRYHALAVSAASVFM